MTITLVQDSEKIRVDGKAFYDVVGQLCAIADTNLRRSDYFDRCLEILSEFFSARTGILNVRSGARTLERSFEQSDGLLNHWHDDIDSLILRVQSNETALIQKFSNKSGKTVVNIVAAPVLSPSGKPFGAIGLVVPANRFANSRTSLALLSQLLNLVVVGAPSGTNNKQNPEAKKSLQSVVRASDYQSIEQLCFAIVNSLCAKLGCEQVSIGLAKRNDVKLIAVSGLSEIPKSTPGMQAVQQSMATCLDRNEISVFQEPGKLVDQCESTNCKIHQIWHTIAGAANVATVPLRIEGVCIAVLALRKKPKNPFTLDDLKRARVLGETFAPALPLVDKASRSIVSHAIDSTQHLVQKWYGWHGLGKKFIAASVVIAMLWATFGKMTHEVIAPCTIAAKKVVTVASPFDGMIEDVRIQSGQRVVAGQVILAFDRSDMLAEKNRLLTDISSNRIEINSLLQHRKPQDALLLQSRIDVLNSELELINQKLERAVIYAKAAGIVLPTDINRRVGQFVKIGEPLVEIADEDQWHLEIATPESEIQFVNPGQKGTFQCKARPDLVMECWVDSISPSSEVDNEKNVVLTDAKLKSKERWMKIGMEGYVKVDAGRKPVWWVYLHPVIDLVRLKTWL